LVGAMVVVALFGPPRPFAVAISAFAAPL